LSVAECDEVEYASEAATFLRICRNLILSISLVGPTFSTSLLLFCCNSQLQSMDVSLSFATGKLILIMEDIWGTNPPSRPFFEGMSSSLWPVFRHD
jgi:hypothetical protein